MNLKEIKEIIALMNENNLNEIEIERDGLKLKLKKSADGVMVGTPTHYAVESIPAPKATSPITSPEGLGVAEASRIIKILSLPWWGPSIFHHHRKLSLLLRSAKLLKWAKWFVSWKP